jgi:hypothetical protein
MVCLSLLTLILFVPASSVAQSSSQTDGIGTPKFTDSSVTTAHADQTTTHLTHIGTSSIGLAGKAAKTLGKYRATLEVDSNFNKNANGTAPARVPSDHVPMPGGNAVTSSNPGFSGFSGITNLDQASAGTGAYAGTQFDLEPPDQALAVGNGEVVEAVNNAIAVYDPSGDLLSGPTPMNQFFGLAPELSTATPPVFGPFVADPKAYFDTDTQRWFVTEAILDVHPSTGNLTGTSGVIIAVSTSPNAQGTYNIFRLDTTDVTGTPDHAGCPCLGDQPLIGADANGFYITTNEFPLFQAGFNGAQVYAMSKTALAAGTMPTVVHFSGLNFLPGLPFFSVQPATVPPGGTQESAQGGTEYFLSSLDFTSTLTNQIAAWALTNTSSLTAATPNVQLAVDVIDSEIYGQPPLAQQMAGPAPLLDLLNSGFFGKLRLEHLGLIASNDDRMNQVVFANGNLWGGVNTVVKTPNGPTRSGIAYFIVTPSLSIGSLSASIANQGYVSVNQNSVVFPSIGVNTSGKGVMTFTLVGENYFPSAAYMPIDAVNGAGAVHVAGAGAGSQDGFTEYPAFGAPVRPRWGDYSAAVADADGSIWLAVEYIPNAPRDIFANWGTFVMHVAP